MNFFTDNDDLQFIFTTADLDTIIQMYEDGFREASRYDEAPEDIADARDHYRRVLTVAGDIAARIIAPAAAAIDETPHILHDNTVMLSAPLQECLQALRQAELMGCTISRRYGGLNLPCFIFTMIVEIISRADASIQNIFGLQGIAGIIETFGDETMKKTSLPLLATGSATGAMALTEEDAGSDLQNVKMKAVPEPDGTWRLWGTKRFITNGCADVLLVLARSEPDTVDGLGLSLFVCERDPTIMIRRLENKLGIHGSPTCELSFQGTPARLIGERQRGLVTYVLALLNGARLATAAQALGIAHAAFHEARAYAAVRRQYGRTIQHLPPVAEMLATMGVSIQAGRALTYATAQVMDLSIGTARILEQGQVEPDAKKTLRKDAKRYERLVMLLTSLAKYYCSEMSVAVTSTAMQVLGGSGYMRDYPVERYYRDARITPIYEGTSQMQVLSAFRGILGGTLQRYLEELGTPDLPPSLRSLAKKLSRQRALLARCGEHLSSINDNQLMDLAARPLVDMACNVLIGHLLLHQARHSRRKLAVARYVIRESDHVLSLLAARIKRIDDFVLRHGADLMGAVPPSARH
ncbi:MAG: acyl-CoA dehydrogenase family protein [Desulfobacterota bacterium]|nr:acyl-CoA dehydrogenase family protein [Thermodesulfobacteriota bacterium]